MRSPSCVSPFRKRDDVSSPRSRASTTRSLGLSLIAAQAGARLRLPEPLRQRVAGSHPGCIHNAGPLNEQGEAVASPCSVRLPIRHSSQGFGSLISGGVFGGSPTNVTRSTRSPSPALLAL